MKKYELTTSTIMRFGRKLFQIKALVSFGDVTAGDLGGYIEKEENLSHEGDAWIYDRALVFDDARVCCNAWVFCDAQVYGSAVISGDARVYGKANVLGNAAVSGNAQVYGTAWVSDNAQVYGDSFVYGDTQVNGGAHVFGDAIVRGDAHVCGDAQVFGYVRIRGDARVYGEARVSSDADYICFKGFGSEGRSTTMFRTKNGDVFVCCGCFEGSLKEFAEKVKKTHGSSKYAKEYLACVDVAKIHFEIGEEND